MVRCATEPDRPIASSGPNDWAATLVIAGNNANTIRPGSRSLAVMEMLLSASRTHDRPIRSLGLAVKCCGAHCGSDSAHFFQTTAALQRNICGEKPRRNAENSPLFRC